MRTRKPSRPRMYTTTQKLLRWKVMRAITALGVFGTVKLCAKTIVQNVSVRTGKGSVDYIDGFLDQTKRGKQMNKMSKFEIYPDRSRFLTWFMALMLVALAAGCGGGGGGGRDPILGTGGNAVLAPTPPTPPTVIAVAPLDNAVGVGINNAIITAAFSEPMNRATLTTATFTVTCTVACTKAPTGTVALDATNRIATFTLTNSPLLPLTTYTATITTGAQSLATGLGLAGPFQWHFTTAATADTTRPTVSLTVPVDVAPAVPTNRILSAVFSEEMNPATITAAGTFAVTCVSPAPCVAPVGDVTYVVGSRTAVFTPRALLIAGQTYTATVTVAAMDLAGNTLIVPAVGGLPVPNPWTFTTVAAPDTAAPLVSSTNPADGAANVPVAQNISATFTETMNTASVVSAFTLTAAPGAVPVPGFVSYDPATSIATFNPNIDLTPGVTYTARIAPTATDLAGNALVVPSVGGLPVPNPWTFTVPAIPPVVVAPAVDLRSATTFGMFGGTAGMTNAGSLTVINGDIGTTSVANASISGFHDAVDTYNEVCPGTPLLATGCGPVNGTLYTCAPASVGSLNVAVNAVQCGIATQARLDANTAFITLRDNFPGGLDVATCPGCGGGGAGELGGRTLAPGVYKSAPGSFAITLGNLTLNAGGDPNAFWVFQMATSLNVGSPGLANSRSVLLTGGALAKNVFWQVGSAATINPAGGGTMEGTIIAGTAATFSTTGNAERVILNGRALSLLPGVTLTNTVITVPAP